MDTPFSFTKPLLESLPFAGTGQRIIYHDTHKNAGGLQLRVTTNAKTFFIQKRVNGKPERVTLGKFPGMTIEQARKRCAELNATIAVGKSPAAEKRRGKLEAKTLAEVFEDFKEARKSLKESTVKDMARALRDSFGDWLSRPIAKITADVVKKCHQEHGKRSEARANLGVRYLRALFNYAMAEYLDENGMPLLTVNPTKALSQTRAWYRVDRRQSIIKLSDLPAWWQSVTSLPDQAMADYFPFVILTGLRLNEALQLTWDRVDLGARTLTIIDPKNHRDHVLPLSDYLLAMLTRRQTLAISNYVFDSGSGKPVVDVRHWQNLVIAQTSIAFTPHDLRRTFATIAEGLDLPFSVTKRLLNHADGANATMGYIIADVERLRAPMQKITDYILKAAGVKPTAEIIELKPGVRA